MFYIAQGTHGAPHAVNMDTKPYNLTESNKIKQSQTI